MEPVKVWWCGRCVCAAVSCETCLLKQDVHVLKGKVAELEARLAVSEKTQPPLRYLSGSVPSS